MKDKKITKQKILNIIFIILWFVLITFIYYVNLIYGVFGNTLIVDTFELLSIIIYLGIPVIIIFLPLILRFIFSKKIIRSLAFSLGMAVIYFLLLFILNKGLVFYFSSFSKEKWDKYQYNRYLMVDDLEKKYELVGMTKFEVIDLLGQSYSEVTYKEELAMRYVIKVGFLTERDFLLFIEDDYVVRIKKNKID